MSKLIKKYLNPDHHHLQEMAYGSVPAPKKAHPLKARLYCIPEKAATAQAAAIVTIPFELANGQEEIPTELEDQLRNEFNAELEKGVTYPQRGPMDISEFRNYFLSYDLIVGVLITKEEADFLIGHPLKSTDDEIELQATKSRLLDGKDWKKAYAFSYYIKPNYPGRSSHLCNAGFVVPPTHRGMGLGGVAGRTFLHYGPSAGYRGSIFNLVYANNEASVRIWERLGFSRIGRIPQAGLLKTKDGQSEEYIDAWIIHGDFATLGKYGKSALPASTE